MKSGIQRYSGLKIRHCSWIWLDRNFEINIVIEILIHLPSACFWHGTEQKTKLCFICQFQIVESRLYFNAPTVINWTASSEFGTYRLGEQWRFRRSCASAQSHQNLRCSLIQAVSQEEPSDRKPDPWPPWMAGHAQLNLVTTECSQTQTRLTGLNYGKTTGQ